MNADVMLFFDRHPEMLPLYEGLEGEILRICPEAQVIVQKSQIAFSVQRRFAFVSMRGKRLIVTFGLPERVEHPHIWQAVEPYPGRWTHHVIVREIEEIDAVLLGWIARACDFACRK